MKMGLFGYAVEVGPGEHVGMVRVGIDFSRTTCLCISVYFGSSVCSSNLGLQERDTTHTVLPSSRVALTRTHVYSSQVCTFSSSTMGCLLKFTYAYGILVVWRVWQKRV